MPDKHASVWDQLCKANGSAKKVVGKCKTCKLLAKKKDALWRIAEVESAGQDETVTDADIKAADAVTPESTSDWCCMYQVLSLQEDFRTWFSTI